MFVKEKNIGIYDVFATSRRKIVQNTAIYNVFTRMCRKHCLAMFFQQGAFNIPQIPRCQSKPTKNTGIYSVLTRLHAKNNNMFKQFFTIFQFMLLLSKKDNFLLYFCHRSPGLKTALNRANLLNCT